MHNLRCPDARRWEIAECGWPGCQCQGAEAVRRPDHVRRYLLNRLVPFAVAPGLVLALLAVLLLALVAGMARAEPPPGADTSTPEAAWYRSLAQPQTGYGCCSIADCRPVASRQQDGHYQAFVARKDFPNGDDAWHDVPDGVVIRDRPNPVGEAVACWYARQVRCFVLPSMT